MSLLEFVAAVIDSLAWPVAFVGVLALFRRQIGSLLPLLSRLRYKDFEVEFREKVNKLAADAQELLAHEAEPEVPDETTTSIVDSLYRLAETYPQAAVLQASLLIEADAAMALQVRDVSGAEDARRLTPLQLGRLLESSGTLTVEEVAIYHQLRELRNRVVHLGDVTISPEDAVEYIDLALFVGRQLRKSTHPSRVARRGSS